MNGRKSEAISLLAVSLLTIAAAAIHVYVGGILLWLNAAGAVAILVALLVSQLVLRRARSLVLLMLAGYSVGSVVGWAIIGPYFDLAYLTKAIELVLVVLIGLELWRTRSEIRPALRWVLSLAAGLPGLGRASGPVGRSARSTTGRD